MNLEELFRQTFTDRIFSRTERRALAKILEEEPLDDHELNVLRSKVFKIVDEELTEVKDKVILEWLRQANKLLKPREEIFENDVFFSPGEDCLHQIQHQIQQARHSISICVFTISDDRIAREILSAHKRNISIKIITDNDKQYDLGSDIQTFIKAGIHVKLDETRYHMHHKFAVFDRKKIITGSYNWTRSAAEFNEENIICSNDPAMVLPFIRQFDKMWNELEFVDNR